MDGISQPVLVKLDLLWGSLRLDVARQLGADRGKASISESEVDWKIIVKVFASTSDSCSPGVPVMNTQARSWEKGGRPKLAHQGILAQESTMRQQPTTCFYYVCSGRCVYS